ncbi:4'-phosphopantetheinyl transferase family protein [Methylotuvimicrobium alcaliphilum]|uniref:4'-phosphopantetheinyl transferase HetI n=1 Tax=Methylotuvimicrobium alcaliphilum (strain DSM 19304 / NCIMB 14124 / VKM B-2133 / 20Z) TaxID=1091494 RepID=G4SYN3_META2|nr:4'-phosphopantetheinyl transferase superfamily protein [Methylotuvimicrobium alcaliphilum]CCE23219.1 putative 4'-phosphopantetheinyl transferase HetI [Methylotuvimicrobium alcaliphilum 20Z]
MDIDLWFETLVITDEEYRYYWSLLDKNEQDKALRFVQTRHGRSYVASHGKLRLILAEYLGMPPETITFSTQAHGKPFVACGNSNGIRFNLAHSGDHMAVGVGYAYDIGVDIEVWTDRVDYHGIVALCFSEEETRFWSDLPKERLQEFFYRLWTRKESFIKVVGLGFSLDVSQVETAVQGPSRFLSLPSGCGSPKGWCLIDLDLANGLSGAVTISGLDMPKIVYKHLG